MNNMKATLFEWCWDLFKSKTARWWCRWGMPPRDGKVIKHNCKCSEREYEIYSFNGCCNIHTKYSTDRFNVLKKSNTCTDYDDRCKNACQPQRKYQIVQSLSGNVQWILYTQQDLQQSINTDAHQRHCQEEVEDVHENYKDVSTFWCVKFITSKEL